MLDDHRVRGLRGLCRFTAEPPADAQRFRSAVDPAIDDVMAVWAVAEQVGYEVLETDRLPVSDWEQEYYGPLRERIAELSFRAKVGLELQSILASTQQEICIFQRHGGSFGYLFVVLRKR